MKIISEIPEDRLLITIHKDEFVKLLGHFSKYDIESGVIKEFIKSERDINISDIYNKHKLIHGLQTLPSYNTARAKLQEMLDALTPIEDKIKDLANKK